MGGGCDAKLTTEEQGPDPGMEKRSRHVLADPGMKKNRPAIMELQSLQRSLSSTRKINRTVTESNRDTHTDTVARKGLLGS